MTANEKSRGKHLLTNEELASHASAGADDLVQGHRGGNGFRVHTIYIVIVSVTALVLLVGAIAIANSTMG
jgi:hypothetical protein